MTSSNSILPTLPSPGCFMPPTPLLASAPSNGRDDPSSKIRMPQPDQTYEHIPAQYGFAKTRFGIGWRLLGRKASIVNPAGGKIGGGSGRGRGCKYVWISGVEGAT